jgi:hypothetical protein
MRGHIKFHLYYGVPSRHDRAARGHAGAIELAAPERLIDRIEQQRADAIRENYRAILTNRDGMPTFPMAGDEPISRKIKTTPQDHRRSGHVA